MSERYEIVRNEALDRYEIHDRASEPPRVVYTSPVQYACGLKMADLERHDAAAAARARGAASDSTTVAAGPRRRLFTRADKPMGAEAADAADTTAPPGERRPVPPSAYIGGGIAIAGIAIAVALVLIGRESGPRPECLTWEREMLAAAQHSAGNHSRTYPNGQAVYGPKADAEWWEATFQATNEWGIYKPKEVFSDKGSEVTTGPVNRPSSCT